MFRWSGGAWARGYENTTEFLPPLPNLQTRWVLAPHPSKGRGPWQGGRGVEVTVPTPRCAHPSPSMGGELITLEPPLFSKHISFLLRPSSFLHDVRYRTSYPGQSFPGSRSRCPSTSALGYRSFRSLSSTSMARFCACVRVSPGFPQRSSPPS